MMNYKEHAATQQNEFEHRIFTTFMQHEDVKSYLEVGSCYGGSLWLAANALPKGSRIVSVDDVGRQELRDCCLELHQLGYDVHTVFHDSHLPHTIEAVRSLSPFDMCFIDADHVYKSVLADWSNYGPMSRLVAFHDICCDKGAMGVRRLWNEIKFNYCYEEFMQDPPEDYYGIGVLYREQNIVAA